MDVPLVTEDDLNNAPSELTAFKATIIKIISDGSNTKIKPHNGFKLELKINKVIQGDISTNDILVVDYGGCHNLPANIESEINVIARKNKEGEYYAPQFWNKKK